MERITFGKTGLSLSRIGFGGLQIATKLTSREAIYLIHFAIDHGINLIETARCYGDSEMRIGKAISGFRRKNVIIATKSGEREPEKFEQELNTSLKMLRTDHIELFMFHGTDKQKDIKAIFHGGLMKSAERAIRSGKIGRIGFSSHWLPVARDLVRKGDFSFVQYPVSYMNREAITQGLLWDVRKRNMGFFVMKPFGGGRLGNARLCLGYLLRTPDIIPLAGFETAKQVQQAVRLAEHPPHLTDRDRNHMARIRKKLGKSFCRGCTYCQPCPQGISIQQIMFIPVYIEQSGFKKVKKWNLEPQLEAVSKCTECRICESRCPFKLKIPETLRNNYRLFQRLSAIY